MATTLVFVAFGEALLSDLENHLLTIAMLSGLTFAGGRTNVLQGAVHLLLFFVYVALLFSP